MPNPSYTVSRFLQSEIAGGLLPGGQYLIGEELQIVAEDALGLAVIEPERIPATLGTIYDFASLTKPLVTALLAVILEERGLLDLNAPLANYLTEFEDKDKREITLTELLTHTSGLPNWRPLYLEAQNRDDVPSAIARILLEPQPSQPKDVIYSDLNYILLGFVLERRTGERLDLLAKREIFEPLGLKRTMFNPPPGVIREIAATERGQEFELANAIADSKTRSWDDKTRFASQYRRAGVSQAHWRKDLIWGEVHDGNANFMGGVAGHAGLFSTARDAFRIANQFLPGSELLRPESLRLFTSNLTRGCNTSRSLAWILAETSDCSAGPALPPTAFGHNGFTGTSLWIDPNKRRVFVLLTNRVHPRVGAIDMRNIRRQFNALAVETLSRDGDGET
ncbi:MAG TPA: serine hydrolase domain-containing protein [Blastocatellia bacterium]|nr:serine hydrolase domain-containing protein [Blastocatellia bacterium]